MLTHAELDILASFFPDIEEIRTTKDIEKAVNYSHERVHTILHNLEKKGLVTKRDLGNVNSFKINKKPELFFVYAYSAEKIKEKLVLKDETREFLDELLKFNAACLHSILFFEKPIEYNGKLFNILCLTWKTEKETHYSKPAAKKDSSVLFMALEEFEKILKDYSRALGLF